MNDTPTEALHSMLGWWSADQQTWFIVAPSLTRVAGSGPSFFAAVEDFKRNLYKAGVRLPERERAAPVNPIGGGVVT